MLGHLTRKININRLLQKFKETSVLVVGDIMMDEFIWGKVSRISPEAPVPVVAVTHDTLLLGGAANVVNNVRSLGGKVLLTGVVGDDRMGEKMKELLAEQEVGLEGIIVDPVRPTSVKTRIIAHNQQMVRFDRESLQPILNQSRKQLLDYIDTYWEQVDGIIISDYGKGVVTQDLMNFIMVKKRTDEKLVAVDPKINNFELYKEVTVLTPNSVEAEAAAGKQIRDEDSLIGLGNYLLDRFASQAILITRGEEGMVLFERRGRITKVPTMAKEVYDVTGAGDTVIGTLTLALATGSDFPEAAVMANYAAGIVVGKVGTAVVTPEELRRAVTEYVSP